MAFANSPDRAHVVSLLHGDHELREVHQDLPPLPTPPMLLHYNGQFQVSTVDQKTVVPRDLIKYN